MGSFLLHVGATASCTHGGDAQPTVTNPRVTVAGMPTVTLSAPYAISGCALPPPPVANGPCVAAHFMTAATRITSFGQPLLLADSQAQCVPSGTPLLVTTSQRRVTGI